MRPRTDTAIASGISGFTFMKSTESGWADYHMDPYTTIKETRDRMCATSMEASWRWARKPADYTASNALVLQTMLDVFASTYAQPHTLVDDDYARYLAEEEFLGQTSLRTGDAA